MDQACGDPACIRRVLDGEPDAYNEIVRRYQSSVYALVMMTTRDRTSAEEVTQDAFMRAYSNLQKYDSTRPFYPWLATIAVRLAINRISRTGRIAAQTDSEVDIADLAADTSSPCADLDARQSKHTLWNHVSELPQGERTAILMFYQQGLTVGEIAGILGVTTGTIKTFLHRGRAHLKTRLQTSGDTK